MMFGLRSPPPKETCLQMAKKLFEIKVKNCQKLSWDYLFCYVMYDHWIKEYWND